MLSNGAAGGGGGGGSIFGKLEPMDGNESEERDRERDSPKPLLFPAKAFHQLNLQSSQQHHGGGGGLVGQGQGSGHGHGHHHHQHHHLHHGSASASAAAAVANLVHQTSPISMRRSNPFSIESLLFNNT